MTIEKSKKPARNLLIIIPNDLLDFWLMKVFLT